jgi:hypothetical protein
MVIGLDYGTYATKIVARPRDNKLGRIIQIEPTATNYVDGTVPSLVTCDNGRLYFGKQAHERPGGQKYRFLKIAMLTNRHFTDDLSVQLGLTPDILVTAYLAWILGNLKTHASLKNFALRLNLAAPINHVEDSDLRDRYLRIINAAWQLSIETNLPPIKQGEFVAQVRHRLSEHLKRPLPAQGLRPFAVLPETLAPVASIIDEGWLNDGIHMAIDIGAGTTEMTVFRVGGKNGRVITPYWSQYNPIGDNDLKSLGSVLDADSPSRNEVFKIFNKLIREIWQRSYQFDMSSQAAKPTWKQLQIILSGGGTRRTTTDDAIRRVNPFFAFQGAHDRDSRDLVLHIKLSRVNGQLEKGDSILPHETFLFAVANGLAIEEKKWPTLNEVSKLKAIPASPNEYDKPVGYWYLGD